MRQYINLYRDLGPRRGGGKDFRRLVGAVSLVVLGGLGASLFLGYQAGGLERQVAENVALRKAVEQRLVDAGRRVAGGDGGARILSLEARLKERENLLAALDAGSLGDMEGYAEYLRALGRHTGQGVWVTGFSVARGGAQLGVSGRAQDAERIPVWLRALNGEKVFQGRQIASLKAAKIVGVGASSGKVQASTHVDFTLGSEELAEPAEAPAQPMAALGGLK
ncbi:MAG: PilN domain-containing protein [Rhodocyclaceae bacterium]|nr:PilN domain-containing protein [Rhodocyclaceae bacterium]